MSDINKNKVRADVLVHIVNESSNPPGKTAVMKFMFFLQHCFGINLGYSFGIYTYGPFSQEVMADIDMANSCGRIDVIYQSYCNKYELTTGNNQPSYSSGLNDNDKEQITKMINLFGEKTAKDLELFSTITYVHISFGQHQKSLDSVIQTVRSLKPHFDDNMVKSAYAELKSMNILPA